MSMGKKKREKKKAALKNIKDSTEKIISDNSNPLTSPEKISEPLENTLIFNDKYINIHEKLSKNIGINFDSIENIFKNIGEDLNSTFSHPWSNWINN